jgi:hypothetical protein
VMPRRLSLPAFPLTLTTIPLLLLTMAASVQDDAAAAQTIPNTGHEITPLAPKGARFTFLNPASLTIPLTSPARPLPAPASATTRPY